jgi:ADP-L-glycero-D-manno-heptose 6-epimerase
MANSDPLQPYAPPTAPPGSVLVTGAAGFIGSHTVRVFLDAGWDVTALDIRPVPPSEGGPHEIVQAEADSSPVLADLRAGRYGAVVHQAAISSTLEDDWGRLEEMNVRQPLALAEAAFAGGARFVYASSHSVYGRIHRRIAVAEHDTDDASVCTGPLNLYAQSKLTLDQEMARRYGPDHPWAGLRYTNVFGTGEDHKGSMASILSQLLRGTAEGRRLQVFSDTLKACRDYIPVESVVQTVLRLVEQGIEPGAYNLGSGCPISFGTLLEWCASLKGAEPLDVRMVENPLPDRYQYWTCASQSRLDSALPGGAAVTIHQVRTASDRLFKHLASRA